LYILASFPLKNQRGVPGIHCSHGCSSPGFSGNLATTVILVCIARPYFTELQELLQSSVRLAIEQSYMVCTLGKVVKPGMSVFLCACEFNLCMREP